MSFIMSKNVEHYYYDNNNNNNNNNKLKTLFKYQNNK